MPAIRNSSLIKRFTDFFRFKVGDMLDGQTPPQIVAAVTQPLPKNIVQIIDVALNDSDKTITVPSGKQWRLLYGFVTLATSAQAGNRRIAMQIRDENNNILYNIQALNVQVASVTESYNFARFGNVGESVATFHTIPIPHDLILSENFQVRILDVGAVDAAVDDMTIRLMVDEINTTGEGI